MIISKMQAEIECKEETKIPRYQTERSAGMDLVASIETGSITLPPGSVRFIGTGVHIGLPQDTVGLILSRSGMARRNLITVFNQPGVLDEDYTGEIGVLLQNSSTEPFVVSDGDRIAQMVVVPRIQVAFNWVDKLTQRSDRTGGFGSTGIRSNKNT